MKKKKASPGYERQTATSKGAKETSGSHTYSAGKGFAYGNSKISSDAFELPDAVHDVLREVSYRLQIPVQRLEVAVAAACLQPETFGVVETLVQLDQNKEHRDKLRIAAKNISEALIQLISSDEDPLAEVDETDEKDVFFGQIEAELETGKLRRMILANCVGVEQAAKLAERTRQRLEHLRREGRLLALRVKNCWRYPQWQFDPDYPGGVLPGLGKVLALLQLSPAGSAAWLTTVFKELGNRSPLDLLRAGQTDDIIEFAEDHGHMP